jgi:hypothetical protein
MAEDNQKNSDGKHKEQPIIIKKIKKGEVDTMVAPGKLLMQILLLL